MLPQSDREVLEERLQNWGRWAADHKKAGCNPLYRMMRLYGVRDGEEEKRDELPPSIDETDAEAVNRAWQLLPEAPHRYQTAKRVLAFHYCFPTATVGMVCRKMGVRQREYFELLDLARYMISCRIG